MNAPHAQPAQTLVDIPYTANTGEKLVNETFGPGDISRRKTGALDMRQMPIENGRPLAASFTLEKNGFVFVEHQTALDEFLDFAVIH